ncbi:MAG: sigma-54 dependent transcriptional regulator, partial [Termitinemataceae bacterium]
SDDREEQLEALSRELIDTCRVIPCKNPERILYLISRINPDAIILDLEMPRWSGFRVLEELKQSPVQPPVLMLSGHAEPLFVVRAMHLGAKDFLSKPYTPSMLRFRLQKLFRPISELSAAPPKIESQPTVLVGSSEQIKTIRAQIPVYAQSNIPILLLGETGTGKDVIARLLHAHSTKVSGPFVVRNMGALPTSIVESELFGCELGAFTDARSHPGCFEQADGGTLFLDEITEARPEIQAALLRVLEDSTVQRLGSCTPRKTNFRLITATNRDLNKLITEGSFRADLKYRLDGLVIHIPPLRERKEDIPELTTYFLSRSEFQTKPTHISSGGIEKLSSYSWPGNIRQLRMCIERAIVHACGNIIEAEHIQF